MESIQLTKMKCASHLNNNKTFNLTAEETKCKTANGKMNLNFCSASYLNKCLTHCYLTVVNVAITSIKIENPTMVDG